MVGQQGGSEKSKSGYSYTTISGSCVPMATSAEHFRLDLHTLSFLRPRDRARHGGMSPSITGGRLSRPPSGRLATRG